MKTVGDLKSYLAREKISPETFAERVKISNMTLRRLLEKAPSAAIPEKYRLQLTVATSEVGDVPLAVPGVHRDFRQLVSELETSGKTVRDVPGLVRDVRKKLASARPGASFTAQVKTLFRVLHEGVSVRDRAICAGALLYFLNPLDAIPDAIAGIGYLDDFAVMTVAISLLCGAIVGTEVVGAKPKS